MQTTTDTITCRTCRRPVARGQRACTTCRRYTDAGMAHAALDDAMDDGTARFFRVSAKYPARCACCGRTIQVGQHAAKTAPGMLLGVCCIIDLHARMRGQR